jgi:putative transposase
LNVHAAVYNLFNIDRHLTSRHTMKEFRGQAFRQWRELTVAA